MCYGHHRDDTPPRPLRPADTPNPHVEYAAAAAENLRLRLAETEARLERARAREAELTRELEQMKRFVLVMEILESYLKRKYREQQLEYIALVLSSTKG